MATYQVLRKSDGALVYEYTAAAPIEWVDFPFNDFDHVAVEGPIPPVPTVYGGRRILTRQEFIDLMGDAAFKAILSMAKVSIDVEAWVKRFDIATVDADGRSINLDDMLTQNGVTALEGALIAQSAVSTGWASGVLNG